jgi:hypothetical protein
MGPAGSAGRAGGEVPGGIIGRGYCRVSVADIVTVQ